MKKILSLPFLVFGLFSPFITKAVCPFCTIAVAAGIGLSRWLGVDDSITGIWIGGLTASMIMWTLNWFNKKNFYFKGVGIVTTLTYYAVVVIPLYFMGFLANSANAVYGAWVDKLTIGIVVGSLGFWAGTEWYELLKKRNGGHAHFPFEKIVVPVVSLLLLSLIFYIIIR